MGQTIRKLREGDAPACRDVYMDAVRNGTAPHYTAEQAAAWALSHHDCDAWADRLASGTTWVADDEGIVGFITLDPHAHLDLFFVRPAARGAGTATRLYDTLIDHARSEGLTQLTTDASHLARSFLEKRGWHAIGTEVATRNGVELTRFPMVLEEIPPAATET